MPPKRMPSRPLWQNLFTPHHLKTSPSKWMPFRLVLSAKTICGALRWENNSFLYAIVHCLKSFRSPRAETPFRPLLKKFSTPNSLLQKFSSLKHDNAPQMDSLWAILLQKFRSLRSLPQTDGIVMVPPRMDAFVAIVAECYRSLAPQNNLRVRMIMPPKRMPFRLPSGYHG